jgi:type I restriction enzyme M protein
VLADTSRAGLRGPTPATVSAAPTDIVVEPSVPSTPDIRSAPLAALPAHPRALIEKLWGYCNVLRDDGLSYGDYVDQLTLLLFLKLAHERSAAASPRIPEGYDWASLVTLQDTELAAHYDVVLARLGSEPGLLGLIFHGARNRIQDPRKLHRLVTHLIDKEKWSRFDGDVKGAIYEGILEKTAGDTKSGAGQYFTPRPLIQAIVEVVRPTPGETVSDPACGTGGFLLAAREHVKDQYLLDHEQLAFADECMLHGSEIVADTARLCAMNLFLHGVAWADARPPVEIRDALAGAPSQRVDVVLANPPFGKYGTHAATDDGKQAARLGRGDFWASTGNKQLNFVQHIVSMLKIGGRAAVVVPDNVLFEGGAGEVVRRELLRECNVHTLLRLPTGLFYAQGIKANVVFFDRGEPTSAMWVYDLRTNQRFTLKSHPLQRADLNEFVAASLPERPLTERVETARFKRWDHDALVARPGCNLDVWADVVDELAVDPAQLEHPEEIARRMIDQVTAGLSALTAVSGEL